jgi:hypothetical protein
LKKYSKIGEFMLSAIKTVWYRTRIKKDQWIKIESSRALVAHTSHPNYSRSRDQENSDSKPAPGKKKDTKIPNIRKGCPQPAQVVEHLSSKHKPLSSNFGTVIKKKKKSRNTFKMTYYKGAIRSLGSKRGFSVIDLG